MPKTVLASKFAEWQGLDRISATVHAMKWIFREISKDDYGLDGEIEVVVPKASGQGFETTGGIIKVQAKSGASYVTQDSPTSFVTPVAKHDLESWRKSNFPVAFIVYHPGDDALYWKEVTGYVKATRGVFKPPVHIKFDKAADRFTPDAADAVRNLANVDQPRISYQGRERHYSNLFQVNRMPRLITCATTPHRTVTDVRRAVTGYVAPFTLIGDTLYTLANLRDGHVALRQACDATRVRDVNVETWLEDPNRRNEFVHLLNQLLGSHLWRIGLRYIAGAFKRNYFPRQDREGTDFKRPWFNVRTQRKSPGRIIAKHYRYGFDEFWRHTAANISFREIGSHWYLQVIPKYFFTSDGDTPYDNEKVGPYTTRIRARERNYHVLNQVLFWADVLAAGSDSIQLRLDRRVLVDIAREPMTGIAPFAIPLDPAIYEEPDEVDELGQTSLFDILVGDPRPAEGDEEQDDEESDDYLN